MQSYELRINETNVILEATRCIAFVDCPQRLRFEIEYEGRFLCSIEFWGNWEFTIGSPNILEPRT